MVLIFTGYQFQLEATDALEIKGQSFLGWFTGNSEFDQTTALTQTQWSVSVCSSLCQSVAVCVGLCQSVAVCSSLRWSDICDSLLLFTLHLLLLRRLHLLWWILWHGLIETNENKGRLWRRQKVWCHGDKFQQNLWTLWILILKEQLIKPRPVIGLKTVQTNLV